MKSQSKLVKCYQILGLPNSFGIENEFQVLLELTIFVAIQYYPP